MAGTNGNGGAISRGNFMIVIASAGILATIGGGYLSQQNNATDKRITELNLAVNNSISSLKEEVVENRRVISKLTAENSAQEKELHRVDFDRKRIDEEVLRLRPLIVSREEHASQDRERRTIIDGIASRVDRLEKDTGAQFTIRDGIKSLSDRLERAEMRLFQRPEAK